MRRRASLWLACTLASACTPDFDNPTTIKDLRFLGARAEPAEFLIDMPQEIIDACRSNRPLNEILTEARPEVLLRAITSVSAQLGPVQVTPLVVDPRGGGREVEYRVVACGNSGSNTGMGGGNNANPVGSAPGDVRDTISRQACPANAMVVAEGRVAARPEDGVVPIAATFTPTPELLFASVASDPRGVCIGLPISIGFTLRAGNEQVVGLKRIILMPRFVPEQMVPNQNPVVPALSHRPNKTTEPVPIMPGAAPLEVAFGAEVNIVVGPAQAEKYQAPAFARIDGHLFMEDVPKETLRYSFYATTGTFSPGQVATDLSPILTNQKRDLESTYRAPVSLGPGESPDVNVFIMVRDERGGASFIQTRLHLH